MRHVVGNEIGPAAGGHVTDHVTHSSHVSPRQRQTVSCVCHAGYRGAACEERDQAACMHSCSGHGACENRMCRCDEGWWGIDCSLSDPTLGGRAGGRAGGDWDGDANERVDGRAGPGDPGAGDVGGGVNGREVNARAAAGSGARGFRDGGGRGRGNSEWAAAGVGSDPTPLGRRCHIPHAPMYVLPLPTHWSQQHTYQGAQEPVRGMYQVRHRSDLGGPPRTAPLDGTPGDPGSRDPGSGSAIAGSGRARDTCGLSGSGIGSTVRASLREE